MSKQEQIKETFEEQLKTVTEKIEEHQTELSRLVEYRTKLLGGLETLQLLEEKEGSEEVLEEALTEQTA
jgi:hypothetical protein